MRKFNVTGKVIPDKHYFVDLGPQIERLMSAIEDEAYFVINRPRQCGKTTVLSFLVQHLLASKEYTPALLSFERFANRPDMREGEFYAAVSILLGKTLNRSGDDISHSALPDSGTTNRDAFFEWLSKLSRNRPRKLVLLIDEIDAVPETVVIGFLAGLREMYLQRDLEPAPHAVGLAGVHDIKNLKARYREGSHSLGSASPFNIAVDYVLPPFSLANIRQYYAQHTEETGQSFEPKVIERVHHVTNGHPWLVSMLAKSMVETVVPDRGQTIRPEHAEEAIQMLVSSRNTNFESLFKNASRPELFTIVLELLQGESRRFNILDDHIDLGIKYGVFAEQNRQLILANPIYAQVLCHHFEDQLPGKGIRDLVARNNFEKGPGQLDFRLILDKFQAFIKAKGAEVVKQSHFQEAAGQLLLMSYLDLLVNGRGWTFKEVYSGQGRIDVLCCYGKQKEVVELKLWYGQRRYEHGLKQLVKYLDSEGLDHGYLVVYDRREQPAQEEHGSQEIEVEGKRILAWIL